MTASRRLIIFDLNKTLITNGSWYDFNIAMGITPEEDELLYRLGPEKEGVLDYTEWIGILKKIIVKRGHGSRREIEKTLLGYSFIDGAESLIKTLQEQGHIVAIISGGFNIVVDDVAHKLGVEHGYNNTYLVFDKEDMLEDILTTWDENRYKTLLVQSVCRRFGIHPKDAYYVADGDNDDEIFGETIGVALCLLDQSHEPWKSQAIDLGESFSRDAAIQKAAHRISSLSEVLNLVED